MKLRKQFIEEYLGREFDSFGMLCSSYGTSRKTGYKWQSRFMNGGFDNLVDKSSAPINHPNRTPEDICQLIIATKHAHTYWGPKKILDYLKRYEPTKALPADSTAGLILEQAGLVKSRKNAGQSPQMNRPLVKVSKTTKFGMSITKGNLS